MASHGRLKFLVGDEFDRELRRIMAQLPDLNDTQVALELRELITRGKAPQEATQLLQARPGVVRIAFDDGRYLIHDAASKSNQIDPIWVAELLQLGADPDERSLRSGDSPVHWVCKSYGPLKPSAHIWALRYLFQAGADFSLLNDQKPVAEGQLPLIIAVNRSYMWNEDKTTPDDHDRRTLELVNACLDYGAKVNATDSSGRTALHWALMSGNAPIVKRLLEAGGDPEMQDAKKRGMLDWWTHQRNRATMDLLKEKMHPRHFAKNQAASANDEEDSEVDSEDEVDQEKELKRYFPAVHRTTAAAGGPKLPGGPPRPVPLPTVSDEHERLVGRLMRFGSRLNWSREVCVDALVKCNWDFNTASAYVCEQLRLKREAGDEPENETKETGRWNVLS